MGKDAEKRMLERIAQVLDVCNRIDRDLAEDRKDLQEFSIRVGALENQFAELRAVVNRMPSKTADKVESVVGDLTHETEGLTEAIKEKKLIVIKRKLSLKFW